MLALCIVAARLRHNTHGFTVALRAIAAQTDLELYPLSSPKLPLAVSRKSSALDGILPPFDTLLTNKPDPRKSSIAVGQYYY
jgi:hypothetical protein